MLTITPDDIKKETKNKAIKDLTAVSINALKIVNTLKKESKKKRNKNAKYSQPEFNLF